MVVRWLRLGCALGLSVALYGHRARAEPLPLELDWRAPRECPTGADVRVELERIAHVNADREPTPLLAHARVQRLQNGYFLELSTLKDGQVGKKKLSARSCAALEEAAALVLALAFGEGVEVSDDSGPTESPAARAQPEPVPGANPARGVLHAQGSAARERLHFLPWIAAVANFGMLASHAQGARAGLGVFGRNLGLELRGSLYLPTDVPKVNGVGAELDAVSGALAGCVRTDPHAVRLSGCAGLELSAIHAASEGATSDRDNTAPHWSLVPSLALTVPVLPPLALRVEADFEIALDRPKFYVSQLGALHQIPEGSGTFGLGIVVEL